MFKRLRYLRWYYWGRWWIKNEINKRARKGQKIKLIIGSGKYYGIEGDWIYTDIDHFDTLQEEDWNYFFYNIPIDNLLAEHVLEHLTESENKIVLNSAYRYLKKGGIFRIAVPDGFNPDPQYIENVKPGGTGPGCDDHKILWNYVSLTKTALESRFKSDLLEYFDEKGSFCSKDYSFEQGFIQRSKKNNFISELSSNYTSLIVDLKKNDAERKED